MATFIDRLYVPGIMPPMIETLVLATLAMGVATGLPELFEVLRRSTWRRLRPLSLRAR
jgi:hypothetical protein